MLVSSAGLGHRTVTWGQHWLISMSNKLERKFKVKTVESHACGINLINASRLFHYWKLVFDRRLLIQEVGEDTGKFIID